MSTPLYLDLRSPERRAEAPLTQARVIILSLAELEAGHHGLTPEEGPIVVICDHGPQARLAAQYLRADGLEARAETL